MSLNFGVSCRRNPVAYNTEETFHFLNKSTTEKVHTVLNQHTSLDPSCAKFSAFPFEVRWAAAACWPHRKKKQSFWTLCFHTMKCRKIFLWGIHGCLSLETHAMYLSSEERLTLIPLNNRNNVDVWKYKPFDLLLMHKFSALRSRKYTKELAVRWAQKQRQVLPWCIRQGTGPHTTLASAPNSFDFGHALSTTRPIVGS